MSTLISPQLIAAGIDVSRVDDVRKHTLGMEVEARNGCRYRYVMAQANVTADNFVKEHTTAHQVNHTAAVAEPPAGVAHVAIGLNKFGWIKVKGVHVGANVATASAAGKTLGSSASAGRFALLDASSTVSQAEARAALAAAGGVGVTAITDAVSNAATVKLS